MTRAELLDLLERSCEGLRANDAGRLPLAAGARFTENNVEFPFGDGVWQTLTGMDDAIWSLADPVTGQAARFGVIEESGEKSLFIMRLAADAAHKMSEMEILVSRPADSGFPFVTTELNDWPALTDEIPADERAARAEMLKLADGYFDTLQQNDGTIHTRFHADCNRRENGVYTTNNARPDFPSITQFGCEDQFALGHYRFDNWIRARRYPLVDEEAGMVLSGGFIDHDGQTREYKLTNGETRMGFFLRPHSFAFLEAFKIRSGAISAVEAVFHFVPYRMRSPWAQDETDPRLAPEIVAGAVTMQTGDDFDG